MNNYERIKNMSIDEMNNLFANYFGCNECPITECFGFGSECSENILRWLLAESEE